MILYDSRSGSTMLSGQLEKFDHCFVTNESAFISRIFSLPKEESAEKTIDYLFEEPQFHDFQLSREKVMTLYSSSEDTKSFIESILLEHLRSRYEWFEDSEKNLIVIKHPPTNHLKKIEMLWPTAIAIVLIRDGRDVHLSKKHSVNLSGIPFSSSAFRSAINWRYKYQTFLTTRWYTVPIRYEDIIQPTFDLTAFVNKLGVSGVKSQELNKEFPVPDSHKNFHQNVGKTIISGNHSKFDTDGYVNFVFSSVCANLLEQFQYGHIMAKKYKKPWHLLRLIGDVVSYSIQSVYRLIQFSLFDRHRFLMRLDKLKSKAT